MRDPVTREATRLTRSSARSFYLASLFLPRSIRRDVHVIYAYYRTVDDLVDEPPKGWSRTRISEELQWWEDGLLDRHCDDHALLRRLISIADCHAIPRRYLTLVLHGARLDLECAEPESMEDLIEYSVLVAGSVGMVMAHVLRARNERAVQAARDLGVAMQLTNVLRDVAEDMERGRIYLPREELRRVRFDPSKLEQRVLLPELRVVIEAIMKEARRRYALGESGIRMLDPQVRFSIMLAATLYSRILDKIERQGCDVFAGRAHLGTIEKWAMAMPTYMRFRHLVRRQLGD